MALRRTIAKHLCNQSVRDQSPLTGTAGDSAFISPSSGKALNGVKSNFHREMLKSPENSSSSSSTSAYPGFFRRFLQQRKINQSPTMNSSELFYFPVGKKVRISGSERINLDGLIPPPPTTKNSPDPAVSVEVLANEGWKIVRCCQLQKVRSTLKRTPSNSITYSEFLAICNDVCKKHDEGLMLAKTLDEAGDVIVLGNLVFIRPDQVVKSMEKLISQVVTIPNDPRKHELKELETKKALIDQKAISKVRGELYCGLALLILQTLGFMRLTFWELSWDVMEPICFFFTSLDFAFAYMFFLRTSNEPTFESYFHRRFKVKQKKLMEVYNFDMEKYQELCEAFYGNDQCKTLSDPVQKLEHGVW